MSGVYQQLNLTILANKLPELLEAARSQQVSYQAFLEQALQVEIEGRLERAQQRRMREPDYHSLRGWSVLSFAFSQAYQSD